MTPEPTSRMVRRVAAALAPDPEADGALLARFLAGRDEDAFAQLVRRHGPMVLGVCRRVTGNSADADDAFQAAFVVLVRKAADLTGRATVGDWLYGVAYHTALKANAMAARRRTNEAKAARPEAAPDANDPADLAALDRALAALPAKYREPVVLCELEGRPRKEVADRLGIPEGTLSSRLATARKRLAARLRDIGFAGVAVGVSPDLLNSTLRAATVAAGHVAGTVPAAVSTLAAGVARTMYLTKLRTGLAVVAVALLGSAAGVGTLSRLTAESPTPTHTAAADGQKTSDKAEPPAVAPPPRTVRPGTIGPPTPGEPDWKTEFRKEYSLADGQVVKLVMEPFAACRADYFAELRPPRPGSPASRPEWSHLCISDDGRRLVWRSMHSRYVSYGANDQIIRIDGMEVSRMLEGVFRIPLQEIEGDESLLKEPVDADFVIRAGSTPEQQMAGLETELRQKFRIPVRLTFREEEREVVLARGKFVSKPREGREKNALDLYAEYLNPETERGNHFAFEQAMERLGRFINRRVIVEAEGPPVGTFLTVREHTRIPHTPTTYAADTDPETVLKNVIAQTGLTFTTEKRKVRVLFVEKLDN